MTGEICKTPEGYNEHDYWKIVAFLEQPDDEGVTNGEKLSETYDPNDPTTWGKYWGNQRFKWIKSDDELRIQEIYVCGHKLCGTLDVSGCTALKELDCRNNRLTTLKVSGCTALEKLCCTRNNLTSLDVSNNTALEVLWCNNNRLFTLDVNNNTALAGLDCSSNNLTALDVSNNTALMTLWCSDNNLTTLDVSSCPQVCCFCDDGVNISREQGGSKR